MKVTSKSRWILILAVWLHVARTLRALLKGSWGFLGKLLGAFLELSWRDLEAPGRHPDEGKIKIQMDLDLGPVAGGLWAESWKLLGALL